MGVGGEKGRAREDERGMGGEGEKIREEGGRDYKVVVFAVWSITKCILITLMQIYPWGACGQIGEI